MAWLQLRISSAHPEFVEEILLGNGAVGVSFIDGEDRPVLEPLPGETPLWENTVTLGLFHDNADLAPAQAALRELLPDGDSVQIKTELVEDQDWVRAWLDHWHPLKFGDRLWVAPAEKIGEINDPAAIILKLDPGLAFGTGTHPTTALCLEWLSQQDLKGKTVLDYGCGSGILAIAALKLGAAATDVSSAERVVIEGTGSFLETKDFADDVRRMRALFRALDDKHKLLSLLDRVQRAREMQIFIGAESEFGSQGDVTLIATPYGTQEQVLGTVGVIGPTRLDYQRVIPLVNFTAKVLSRVLKPE